MSTPTADPWFQTLFADRIGGAGYGKSTALYKFEKIKRARRAAAADFPDRAVLDFGIGENDEPADPLVRDCLKREVDDPENRGYADNGIAEFKEAAADYLRRWFDVSVDAQTEICHGIGTKPVYALLPACFINPGDVTLMTVPGYPVAGTHTRYLGGEVFPLPLRRENGFFPDLTAIPADVLRRAKLLVLNYPNSPTGALATRAFYEEVVAFARRYQVVVVQDAAHILLTYDREPLSFLSVPGAKEVGVEVHSLSKGFHMIGWRMGFVAGHPLIVRAYSDVKDNTDCGQFKAIQKAAALALRTPAIAERARAKYRRRLAKLVVALRQAGFAAAMPGGTYFLYVPAPVAAGGTRFANAEEAAEHLIRRQSIVCVPWDDAGPHLRFSTTYLAADEDAEDAIMADLVARLRTLELRFAD
jgi:LL-diaminopimelate aminotransferase